MGDIKKSKAPIEETPHDDSDPHINKSESQMAPIKELKSFLANPQDLTQVLRIGRDLPHKAKEEFKRFL